MSGFSARLRGIYNRIPGVQRRAVNRARRDMDDLGRRIVANARRRVNVRSGALRDSIGYRIIDGGDQLRLRIFATAPHARWVHDGTRPHEIRPRHARALRFRTGGRVVFAQRVWHPGTRGTKFLAKAVEEEKARMRR